MELAKNGHAIYMLVRNTEKGEQVKLSGFGNFDLRFKNQRPGRNPKTGEEIPISARRVVTFRPGQRLWSDEDGGVVLDEAPAG